MSEHHRLSVKWLYRGSISESRYLLITLNTVLNLKIENQICSSAKLRICPTSRKDGTEENTTPSVSLASRVLERN